MASRTTPDLDTIEHHWRDESDAAYLYRALADVEPDEKKRDIYARLAIVEDRHTVIWKQVLVDNGRLVGDAPPSLRARVMATMARRLGPRSILPMLLAEEGREVKGYLDMHRSTMPGVAGSGEALALARESAEHASTLAGITGRGPEPWHNTGSGGLLRNVVYGFNDGLTANFGLVAGVLGAAVSQQHTAIVVAGVAGLIADALSMGSSGYLAAKSEREVYDYEIAMERDEIALMPEVERDEMALIYEAKGMEPAAAHALATKIMADPKRMLDEHVREELKIDLDVASPMREAWITGSATAFGAAIPVAPFFFLQGTAAIVTSFTVAMASHFAVGAARSLFTGRSIIRSGMDMFVVGLGVAAVGYYVGEWIARVI